MSNLRCAGSKCHTPANYFSWWAKPHEGVVFTLHYWVEELQRQPTAWAEGSPDGLNGLVYGLRVTTPYSWFLAVSQEFGEEMGTAKLFEAH